MVSFSIPAATYLITPKKSGDIRITSYQKTLDLLTAFTIVSAFYDSKSVSKVVGYNASLAEKRKIKKYKYDLSPIFQRNYRCRKTIGSLPFIKDILRISRDALQTVQKILSLKSSFPDPVSFGKRIRDSRGLD